MLAELGMALGIFGSFAYLLLIIWCILKLLEEVFLLAGVGISKLHEEASISTGYITAGLMIATWFVHKEMHSFLLIAAILIFSSATDDAISKKEEKIRRKIRRMKKDRAA